MESFFGLNRERFASQQEYWFARSAFIYTNFGCLIAVTYAVFYASIGAHISSWALGTLGFVLLATTPLHRWGQSDLLAKINLSATSVSLAVVVAHTGGIISSAACWLLGVAPGITALLFRRHKPIIQLTCLTVCLYIGIFIMQLRGYKVNQLGFPVGSVFELTYNFVHFTIFSFFIAAALSIFSITQKKLFENLQSNKDKLEKTTSNLHAIFESIHQAVFLVQQDLTIASERSARFQDILGRDIVSIEGLLKKSRTSRDRQTQVLETLKSCMDEEALCFQVNEHLLPDEIFYRKTPDAPEQILGVSWSPILHANKVRNVLVEIRDKTIWVQTKEKERTLSHRNKLLLALLEVDSKSLPTIVADLELLAQRISALRSSGGNIPALKAVIHTLKGNARSAKLLEIADICHDLEEQLAGNAKAEKTDPLFDQLALQIKEYAQTYRETIGRSHASEATADMDPTELLSIVERLNGRPELSDVQQSLRRYLPNSLFQMLGHFHTTLDLLAKELDKPRVAVVIDDPGFLLPNEASQALKHALGHVLRNAVDHGIEAPEARQQNGKSPKGTIHFTARQEAGFYHLQIHDDGRGLNLEKIRAKAEAKGLRAQTDEELAQLIFEDNFSTRQDVSMTSGRGIGMSAVRSELTKLSGAIEVQFTGPERQGYRPFRFHLYWPAALEAAS